MRRHRLFLTALCIGLAGCSTSQTQEPSAMTTTISLTSPAFDEGGAIPVEYTCDGEGGSPPLSWTDVPDGVDSFALLVTDPDAGGFVHLVLTGIPADVRALAEGEGDAYTAGRNGFGQIGWGGPCPPSGQHRYVFELLALSEALDVGAEPSLEAVRSAAEGRVVARGELTGVYGR